MSFAVLRAGAIASAWRAPPLLLDAVAGAAAAYSLRKLRLAYAGSAVRVRRSSDNAEQDIGFTSVGDFEQAAFSAHVGAGSGFATKAYDQSGNARDLAQATTTRQVQLLLNIINGKPVMRGDGIDDFFALAFTLNQPAHVFAVIRQVAWTNTDSVWDGGTSNRMRLMQLSPSPGLATYAGNFGPSTNALAVGTAGVLSVLYSGASSKLRLNGGAAVTGDVGANIPGGVTLFSRGTAPFELANVDIPEFIVYPADKSADEAAVVANMMAYWGVS